MCDPKLDAWIDIRFWRQFRKTCDQSAPHSRMTESTDAVESSYDLLARLRDARRDLHERLTGEFGTRERVLAPARMLQTLREFVQRGASSEPPQRCRELFILTVLLYGALDWHFAGHGIDIEADVQLERLQQNYRFGGPEVDARLSPREWHMRIEHQVARLEQQLAVKDLYATRLIKLTALAQAALEAATRQIRAA